MQTVIVGQLFLPERLAHRVRIRRREAVCLEIGETPIGLPERRIEIECAAVRIDGVRDPARGPECMAKAHPHLGLEGMVAEHRLIHRDGIGVLPEVREHRRLKIQVSGIARVLGE